MKKPKLTPWFAGNVKPIRKGFYDVRYEGDREAYEVRYYFDGINWCRDKTGFAISFGGFRWPKDQWRGLTSKAAA